MDITYFPNAVAQNAHPVLSAMIRALQYRGHRLIPNNMTADAAMIWSVLWAGRMKTNHAVFDTFRSQNKPVIVIEVGCLKRGTFWKIGLNGTLPRNSLAACVASNNRRSILGLNLQPWQFKRADNIIICLQRTQSWQWQGMPSAELWVQELVDEIRRYSNRPIIVRPHPRQKIAYIPKGCRLMMPKQNPGTYDDFDFENNLKHAWAIINFNSHPGIQSIIQGIPAFVGSTSLAAPVANLDLITIENPKMPDRDQWFEDLCCTEFSLDEITRGMPLDSLILS